MKNKFAGLFSSVSTAVRKHSPEILTGLGIAGMVGTTVLAVKATPKAIQLIDNMKEEKAELDEEVTKIDCVKAVWKCYIPAAITCAASATCLIGASSVNAKRNAAITAAYEISRTALADYKEAVVETIGEKKAKEVQETVAKKQVESEPAVEQHILITEDGDTLCYDTISGRYFKTDVNKIDKAQNELNRRLMDEMYISLNEFFYELGLPQTKIGNELGWNINDGLIDLVKSSTLTEDGKPCLVIDYCVAPRYGYSDFSRY